MNAFKLKAAVSAMALLAAAPALADVTAQQVWDDWKAQMGVYGESAVTIGSETNENGVLTVTDLGFNVTGEDGSTAKGNLPQLVFTENGDGTVSVTMSEEYPITISTPADASTGSKASDVALALRQSGLQMTVSGNPGDLTYDVSAARYAIELDSVKEDGAEVPAEAMLAFNDLSGTYTSKTAAMRDVTYDLAAASMDLLLDATNPDDNSHVMLSGKVNQVATKATVSMPLDPAADPEMMVMNGMAMDGGYTTAGGQYIFEFTDASGPTNGTFSTQGSALNFQFNKDSIAYDSNATGVALQATSAAMPIPVNATIGEYGLKFQMPLSKSDAPAPWAAGLTLRDLAINDEVWGMFDPQGVLPHDPATVAVDLSGTATMLFDAMDPAQAEAMAASEMPAQVNSVDIKEVNVTFGGASVTGTGSFTLDNNDLTTFPGMPKPTGTLDLQLKGVKALINNLATMGLLPQDQVMVGLGMLGAFATETAPDELTSHIEATQDGQLLVNGNPMPMQ